MTSKRMMVIRGARVLDAPAHSADKRDILVNNGLIVEVGPPDMAAPPDAEIVRAADQLLMPGLINAHSHGHGSLSKGLGDRWSLELLLNAGPWLNAERTVHDKYLSALLNAAELARKGCTAVYDLYAEFPIPSAEGIDAVARGYHDVGIRAVIAPMIADRTLMEAIPSLADTLPARQRSQLERISLAPAQQTLSACRDIASNWRYDRALIRPAIAPTIPLHCSDEFIIGSKIVAEEFDLGLHTHLAELRVQAISGLRRYGKTLTAHLDDLGFLGPNVTAAHCVWLDDNDIARLAHHGCKVAHNPGSNLRLGSGVARLQKIAECGITVGIGTDGAQCSDHQNMFEAMRLASFVSRIQTPDVNNWMSTQDIVRMATAGSAVALGFGDTIGHLSAGAKADIVFLDLTNINFVPFNDPTNQLVHSEDGSAVSNVMVDGKFVIRDGRFTTVDYDDLRAKVQNVVSRLVSANAERRAFAEQLAQHIASFCVGLAREPYHITRWLA